MCLPAASQLRAHGGQPHLSPGPVERNRPQHSNRNPTVLPSSRYSPVDSLCFTPSQTCFIPVLSIRFTSRKICCPSFVVVCRCVQNDAELLAAWREGRTGYPWIDAAMTQLREEGWIHHLARHAVACFLTRGDLWQSWERGAEVRAGGHFRREENVHRDACWCRHEAALSRLLDSTHDGALLLLAGV